MRAGEYDPVHYELMVTDAILARSEYYFPEVTSKSTETLETSPDTQTKCRWQYKHPEVYRINQKLQPKPIIPSSSEADLATAIGAMLQARAFLIELGYLSYINIPTVEFANKEAWRILTRASSCTM